MRIFLSADYLEIPAHLRQRSDLDWLRFRDSGTIPDAELYIWDHALAIDLRSSVLERRTAQHLVVTDQNRLAELGEIQNFACILLKPVAPVTLKAFVELALKSWKVHRQAREAEILRLDRDTLLKYVLEVNLKLQQYDQERSNFLARALHDFRAPLTALYGYCGLLAQGNLGPVSSRQFELLSRMRNNAKRLARLAESTLNLLLQGRFEKPIALREAPLEIILSRALDDVYPLFEQKHIQVEKSIEPPEGVLLLEPEQIQEVVVNLLENSCKFTPENGRVSIHGYNASQAARDGLKMNCDGDRCPPTTYRVDISDSGPGVLAELAEKVFEEYSSYSGSADRSGGGLGLAICRAIIAAHGGRIWTTPDEGGGRFSFALPLKLFPTNAGATSLPSERGEVANALCS